MLRQPRINHSQGHSRISIRLIGAIVALMFPTLPVFAQADAILPPIGGPGGGQFVARCNPGQYLTGLQLRTADDVDAIRPLCVTIYGPTDVGPPEPFGPYRGGNGGTPRDLVCPSSTPIVIGFEIGQEGDATVIVNNIHLFCGVAATTQRETKFPSAVFDGPMEKRSYRYPLSAQRCPDGYIALGINGRSGIWLDSVGLICGVPRLTPKANVSSGTTVSPTGKPKTSVSSLGRVEVAAPPAFIYAVANDAAGSLQWFRHDGSTGGKFDWQGPRVVNTAWSDFKQIFPGGDGKIYAVTSRGTLILYQHTGFRTGLGRDDPGGWLPPQLIATGWGNVTHAFSGGAGVIYSITADGKLRWYRLASLAGGKAALEGPKEIGRGWGDVKQVFSIGDGIIYVITEDGKLKWLRHNGFLTGDGLESSEAWVGPKEVGAGWGIYKQVFSTGKGVIYGIASDGKLMWHRHKGFKDASMTWDGPLQVGTGWGEALHVFAQP